MNYRNEQRALVRFDFRNLITLCQCFIFYKFFSLNNFIPKFPSEKKNIYTKSEGAVGQLSDEADLPVS